MYRIITCFALASSILAMGCIKTNSAQGSAALNIVNAVNSSTPIVTNFTPLNAKGQFTSTLQYYLTANQISSGSSYESGSYVGATWLSVSQISDTAVTLWSGELILPQGSIHSLFFCGDTTAIDTLLTTDLIPYYPNSDSVSGVRFVNLVKGSGPMSVDIQGNPPMQYEFSGLGYKQMSTFKAYNVSSGGPGSYTFEIRDQDTDSLLTTFAWRYTLEKSNTIVIEGSENPNTTTLVEAFQTNNF
jgi:hypothetical protein